MGKDIGVGIDSGLISLAVHICSGQHFSVGRQDLSPDDPVCKGILSGIVRTVDKILAPKYIEVRQVADQGDKDGHKEIRDNRKLSISGTFFLFSALSRDILGFRMGVPLSRLEIFLPAVVFFVFFPQFPHPHLLSIYKVLE